MSTSNEEHIFTRYDIYKLLMKERPGYRGDHDYYSLERYLSVIYNCDCTDCGGPDFSRRCNVEKIFYEKHSVIKYNSMV